MAEKTKTAAPESEKEVKTEKAVKTTKSAEKTEKAVKATKPESEKADVKTEKPVKAAKPESENTEAKTEKATKASKSEKAAKSVEKTENRLKLRYKNEVAPALFKHFNYKNVNQIPKLVKIVINSGLGDVKDNSKSFQLGVDELKSISGQRPIVTKAKKSVANFKVREGQSIGAKVTLRSERMYEFFDKLISIALPRVRDFRGVPANSFDGRGNYSLGIKEQLIFPEIIFDQVEKTRGFDITFVTTAQTDEEAKELLKLMGMPFKA
jgi:large subunit ribosomal protein L5